LSNGPEQFGLEREKPTPIRGNTPMAKAAKKAKKASKKPAAKKKAKKR
jgi:hypothetical protein